MGRIDGDEGRRVARLSAVLAGLCFSATCVLCRLSSLATLAAMLPTAQVAVAVTVEEEEAVAVVEEEVVEAAAVVVVA